MSILGWIEGKLTGVDINAQQDLNDKLDKQLADMNAVTYGGSADYGTVLQHEATQQADSQNLDLQVADAFGSGLADAVPKVRAGWGSIISGIFKLIPWQMWLLLAILLFLWMGGAKFLKGILSK